jgi:hypothetical protein
MRRVNELNRRYRWRVDGGWMLMFGRSADFWWRQHQALQIRRALAKGQRPMVVCPSEKVAKRHAEQWGLPIEIYKWTKPETLDGLRITHAWYDEGGPCDD